MVREKGWGKNKGRKKEEIESELKGNEEEKEDLKEKERG
jgi:hypothetical protein